MSRSLIQVSNQSSQDVAENSIISLGSVLRRFGCNCRLSGNAIEVTGEGYYTIDASVTATPTAIGDVTVALYKNGVQVPGAIATATAGAVGDSVALPITTTIRQGCRCDDTDNLTLVLIKCAGAVSNVSMRVEKV